MKRYCKNLSFVLLIILVIYPVVFLSGVFWNYLGSPVGIFLNNLEKLTKDYQYTFQALGSLGILGIPFTWYQWKKKEQEGLRRNLSSISVDVNLEAVAEIKNTSSVDGSELLIKVYKPYNFEDANKNEEFLKYVAISKKDYLEKSKSLIKYDLISWSPDPSLVAVLSIGEIAKFHLKNLQEELFVHFAPIKIIISSNNSFGEPKEKYMLFRFVNEKLRNIPGDNFIQTEMHPYGSWTLINSKML